MTNYLRLLCLGVMVSLLMIACNADEDQFPPEILAYQLEAKTVLPGDGLSVFVEVRDNQDLNQMRFRIRNAFNKEWTPWSLVRVIDLSERSFAESYQFLLPDSALAGLYEIGFQVVDFSGNASIDSLQFFSVIRPGVQAEFVDFSPIPAPDENEALHLAAGDSIRFTGQIVDSNGLNRVITELKSANGSTLQSFTYQLGDTLQIWSASEASSLQLDALEEQPVSLQVRVFNRDGHQSRVSYNIVFMP